MYNISTITIHNNLTFLKKQKITIHTYNNTLIYNNTTPSIKPSIKNKNTLNTTIKHNITKTTIKLIQPDHQIILNSKTTTFKITHLIHKHTNIITITNNINITNTLLKTKNIKLLITNKHLHHQSQSFYNNQTKQSLQNYHFNILFLNINTINLKHNINTHNKNKTHLNHQIYKITKQIIIITNSNKFNHSNLHKIINTQHINIIIINKNIPTNNLKKLQKTKIKIILIKK